MVSRIARLLVICFLSVGPLIHPAPARAQALDWILTGIDVLTTIEDRNTPFVTKTVFNDLQRYSRDTRSWAAPFSGVVENSFFGGRVTASGSVQVTVQLPSRVPYGGQFLAGAAASHDISYAVRPCSGCLQSGDYIQTTGSSELRLTPITNDRVARTQRTSWQESGPFRSRKVRQHLIGAECLTAAANSGPNAAEDIDIESQISVFGSHGAGLLVVRVRATAHYRSSDVVSDSGLVISGRVTDTAGRPIPNAIILNEQKLGAVTNASGVYTFTNVVPGSHRLFPAAAAYTLAPTERLVTVPPSVTNADFVGTPAPIVAGDTPGGPAALLPPRTAAACGELAGRIELYPTILETFSNPGNQTPAAFPVTMTLRFAESATWHAGTTTGDESGWLGISPSSGTLLADTPTVVTVTVDSSRFEQGKVYTGSITFGSLDAPNTPITVAVQTTVISKPVVFVHGIGGSTLINAADSEIWPNPLRYLDRRQMNLYPSEPKTILVPGDAIRFVSGLPESLGDIYGTLLRSLTNAGYREYQAINLPNRRTSAGCDLAQRPNNPNLFVFPYDWRQDNQQSAERLLDFVDCIERFYPGTRVDIIAHSNGNLVARRAALLRPPESHHIEAHLAIAPPWLGGPKLTYALETGDFDSKVVPLETFKFLVGSWTAAHQLVPPRAYYALGAPPPLGVFGPNARGATPPGQFADYEAAVRSLNARYAYDGFAPGTANRLFHDFASPYGNQDDWSNREKSGVRYFMLYGVRPAADTIAQLLVFETVTCRSDGPDRLTCTSVATVGLTYTAGDGTVPLLSAQRKNAGLDLNAPGTVLIPFVSADPNRVEHTGLTANPAVHAELFARIAELDTPAAAQAPTVSRADPVIPPSAPAYYLSLVGPANPLLTDGAGNRLSTSRAVTESLPGVSLLVPGPNQAEYVLPSGSSYTVTFAVPAGPLAVLIRHGTESTSDESFAYRDLTLPPGRTATITFGPAGFNALRYDGDGDGLADAIVPPTASANGASVDVTPPDITFSAQTQGAKRLVTVSAADPAGVQAIFVSTDKITFTRYTGPVPIDPTATPYLYAFAEDTIGNRSPLRAYPDDGSRVFVGAGPVRLTSGW